MDMQWIYASVLALAMLGFCVIFWSALRLIALPRSSRHFFFRSPSGAGASLVVIVHGLNGREAFSAVEDLVAEAIPDADRLVIDYGRSYLSNLDAYAVADDIERAVHDRFSSQSYDRILLLGYSAGAALLRKAFVWASGDEKDRSRFGKSGRREWVDRVERIVLLAGMNRGWSIRPKPAQMSLFTYIVIRSGEIVSRIFGVGLFAMSMRRGAPFIADTRVQWIRLARSEEALLGKYRLPQTIQLIGSIDDVVSREDGADLLAMNGAIFKTLPQTGHRQITAAISGDGSSGARNRRLRIRQALLGDLKALEPDCTDDITEHRNVSRIVYLMHGIRDYGNWTDVLKSSVESRCRAIDENVAVISMKYGYFPMLRFILYGDRQRNVRLFMDQYTEDLARYPMAKHIDFAGHSNGTYLLASAMQSYASVEVRRVFFAGSVVPKHYPWSELISGGRVTRVVNVVATEDCVVALFPKLFEQIADLWKIQPVTGWLDLGAAGFRGFLDSGEQLAVRDLKFSIGKHSTGVDVEDPNKLEAITLYIALGDESGLKAFELARSQNKVISFFSNITPVVWAVLIGIVAVFAWGALCFFGLIGLVIFILLIASVLYMV